MPDTTPVRLLIVDNEVDAREWLAEWLRQSHGFDVATAGGSADAFAHLEHVSGDKDVILMDIRLGGGPDGIETMKSIRARYPIIEVILITGFGSVDDGVRAMKEGAYGYVLKPLNRDEVVVYIRSATERRRMKAALAETAGEREWLRSMLEINSAVQSARRLDEVLKMIVDGIQRLDYDRVRLYLLKNGVLVGTVQAGETPGRFEGLRLSPEEDPYSRKTLVTKKSNIYHHGDLGPAVNVAILGKEDLEEWAELPLVVRGEAIGIICIDNKYDRRRISDRELGLLMLFANQAALAIDNTQLNSQSIQRGEQLNALDQIALDITRRLETKELLQMIVERATELVQGTGGGVYLFDEVDKLFRLEAVCGLPSELVGQRFPKDVGVIGEVLRIRQPVAVQDYQHWSGRLGALNKLKLTTVVGAPILSGDHFLGAIAIHDTKEGRSFEEGEKELLLRFANHAAVALENAKAYNAQRETRNYLDQLISSSLDGIIAVDENGWVTLFNQGAEHILGYHAEEVLNKKMRVDQLHGSLEIARTINRDLYEQGTLENYESTIRSKDSQQVPILLSASQIRNSQGNVVGSVGYFKDLRPLKKAEAELKQRLKEQRLLLDVMNTVASTQSVEQGLNALAEKMVNGLIITFCHIALLDDTVQKLVVKAAYPIPRPQSTPLQWDPGVGKSLDVPPKQYLLDQVGPVVFREADVVQDLNVLRHIEKEVGLAGQLQSALVIPLRASDKVLGICTLGEMRNCERSEFTKDRMELAHSMATQGASLIARIRLEEQIRREVRELQHMRQATEALAGPASIPEVLQQIVKSAKDLLAASSSAIWSYDMARHAFVPEELVAEGIPSVLLKQFQQEESAPGSTTRTILERRYVFIDDISGPRAEFLGSSTHKLLREIGATGLQGIALGTEEEPLGILYVNYATARTFTSENRDVLETFANHAALALKKARLLDQVNKAQNAAKVVARLMRLGDRGVTLQSVTEGTQAVVGCDSVVLYAYNEKEQRLEHPPTLVGVKFPEQAQAAGHVIRESLVYAMLAKDDPYIVESSAKDPLFRDRRFTRDEGIVSCVAIPLQAGGQKVGVMFANYRTPHHFTEDELTNLELFANQAAVAIWNSRLYEQAKINDQEALLRLSQDSLVTLDVQTMLERTVELVARVLGTEFCDIVLPDEDNKLIMRAAVGWDRALIGTYSFSPGSGSQTGFTIACKEPVVVDNVVEERRFTILPIVHEHGIKSAISVPIFSGGEVKGAMLAHTKRRRHFSTEEVRFLQIIANQSAAAVRNAQLYDKTETKSAHLKALYDAAKAISGSLNADRKPILDRILEQAVERITSVRGAKAVVGTIHFVDEAKQALRLESVYPPQRLTDLGAELGKGRPLDRALAPGGKIGITGRVALTGIAEAVNQVKLDPDYLPFNPTTKSELDVPLKDGNRVIGVLSTEYDTESAFDSDDQETLQALADLAVLVIKRAVQQAEFIEMREREIRQKGLNRFAVIANSWLHTVNGDASSIRDGADNIMDYLGGKMLNLDLPASIQTIRRLAQNILNVRITGALAGEDVIESIGSNALVDQRLRHLTAKYGGVGFEWDDRVGDAVTVRGSRIYLLIAIDRLIENALEAMKKVGSSKPLRVSTRLRKDKTLDILIRDTGGGIPQSVLRILGQLPIPKEPGDEGNGTGWLVIKLIAEDLGGSADVLETSPSGTTVCLSLPVEN